MDKKQFIINGKNFSNLDSFYNEVNKILCPNFKEFGRNLDAFDDILNGGFETFEREEKIDLIWKNSKKSINDLGYNETSKFYKKALISAILNFRFSNIKDLVEKYSDSKKQKGRTLFEIIVKITNENKNVNLILEQD